MRIALEKGPKGRRHVAYALDWPGLERNGKTPEDAVEKMESYRDRYQTIADRAGLGDEFRAEPIGRVVHEYIGTPSTDFWGISFAQSELDHQPVTPEELARQLALLNSCWSEFDAIATRVSEVMQKGKRGGGRDREQIVRHVLSAELDWVTKLGIRLDLEAVYPPEGRRTFHAAVSESIRIHHEQGTLAKNKGGPEWKLPFFVRHLAYHVMDHAWEMEDKDLSDNGLV